MNQLKYIQRSLGYFKKQHIAVFLAALISTAVLTGALIVGDSVKYSLQKTVDKRLGMIEHALFTGDRFVRSELSKQLANDLNTKTASLLLMQGVAINTENQKRINKTQIIGIETDFWELSEINMPALNTNEIILSQNTADKLGVDVGDKLLLRIRNADIIPINAPFNNDENSGISLRIIVKAIADDNKLGRFSLRNKQGAPYNLFINRDFLQEKLSLPDMSNLIVSSGNDVVSVQKMNESLEKNWKLKDAALQINRLEKDQKLELVSNRIFIDKQLSEKIAQIDFPNETILTYFVNALKGNKTETPYSFVTAASKGFLGEQIDHSEIIINSWLADDLQVNVGDSLAMSYYTIGPFRTLKEVSEHFVIRKIIPMDEAFADRTLMPAFPGLTDAENCTDWETGIPIDLKKIRNKDEKYWADFGGTPKAFISMQKGRELWDNQFGNYTSIRYNSEVISKTELEEIVLSAIAPQDLNLQFINVREEGNRAAANGVNFGELFLSLSFFVIAAALLLMVLIYSLNTESRQPETGILFGLGFTKKQILKLRINESLPIIFFSGIFGGFAGIIYNNFMLSGLNSIWNDAVHYGTIELFIEPDTILFGMAIGITTSLLSIYFVTRRNLKNTIVASIGRSSRKKKTLFSTAIAIGGTVTSLIILFYALFNSIDSNAGLVLTAGFLFMVGCIALVSIVIHPKSNHLERKQIQLIGLSIVNIARYKGRSLAVLALLSIGTFTIIVTGANRQTFKGTENQRQSGTGGFKFWVENTVPFLQNLNTQEGKAHYGLDDEDVLENVQFVQFLSLGGDDASCLNLNQVQQPQILGVNPQLFDSLDAFSFANLLTKSDDPWLELKKEYGEGVIPAFADQTVIQWGLMKAVGDTLRYHNESGQLIKLLLVGGLNSSVFQGNLIISEQNFRMNFPGSGGSTLMLVDGPANQIKEVEDLMTHLLSDYGIEVNSAPERLSVFYSVTNTYLTIFMILGGLGVLIGTFGLGIVLMRNMIERKQELALYAALGFTKSQIFRLVFVENLFLLVTGMAIGFLSATIGILPSLLSTAFHMPGNFLFVIVSIVFISGLMWVYFPARVILRKQLPENLRNE